MRRQHATSNKRTLRLLTLEDLPRSRGTKNSTIRCGSSHTSHSASVIGKTLLLSIIPDCPPAPLHPNQASATAHTRIKLGSAGCRGSRLFLDFASLQSRQIFRPDADVSQIKPRTNQCTWRASTYRQTQVRTPVPELRTLWCLSLAARGRTLVFGNTSLPRQQHWSRSVCSVERAQESPGIFSDQPK
jgi:hypothetical protein